jgi:hypothetical protein
LKTPQRLLQTAFIATAQQYTIVDTPKLAIFAVSHQCKPRCGTPEAKALAAADAAQARIVKVHDPHARIVRLPYAKHFVYQFIEADVVRDMNTLMDGLPH